MSPGPHATPPPPPQTDQHADKGWAIADIQSQTQFGVTSVSGRVTNTADTARSSLLTLTVFAGVTRVATCDGGANQVAAHDTVTVHVRLYADG